MPLGVGVGRTSPVSLFFTFIVFIFFSQSMILSKLLLRRACVIFKYMYFFSVHKFSLFWGFFFI